MRAIPIILTSVLLFTTVSAYADIDFRGVVNKVSESCSLSQEQQDEFVKNYEQVKKDVYYNNNIEFVTTQMRDKCVGNELTNHVHQTENEDDYNKLTQFTEATTVLRQNVYGHSSAYSYVDVKIAISEAIGYLTNLFNPDYLQELPDITGKTTQGEEIQKSISNIIPAPIKPVYVAGQKFLDLSGLHQIMISLGLGFLFIWLIFTLFVAMFKKNPLIHASQGFLNLVHRAALLCFAASLLSFTIFATNYISRVATNTVATSQGVCESTSVWTCLNGKINDAALKTDYLKADKADIANRHKNVVVAAVEFANNLKSPANLSNEVVKQVITLLLYTAPFLLIQIAILYRQAFFFIILVMILVKYVVWIFTTFHSAFAPHATFKKMIGDLMSLALTDFKTRAAILITTIILLFIAGSGISGLGLILITIICFGGTTFISQISDFYSPIRQAQDHMKKRKEEKEKKVKEAAKALSQAKAKKQVERAEQAAGKSAKKAVSEGVKNSEVKAMRNKAAQAVSKLNPFKKK